MSEPMKLSARVTAPLKAVHHALTDPGELRVWLAEHAEVELPHRYAFWGRHTPDGQEPRQRPLHVDDRTLRFSWPLGGEETTVEISLEEESAESTIVTLTQTHFDQEAAMADSGVLGMTQTFWCLSIANLVDHLEGRELTPKADFTSPVLREELVIGGSPEAVFDSLVDPEKFSRWFGYKVDMEPYVGGRFAMGGFEANDTPAKVVALEPGRGLTLEWPGLGVSSWELEGSGGATRLTFVESGFDEKNPPYAGWMGWLSGIAELRRFHELSDWRPIWLDASVPGSPEQTGVSG
ncbi:SRPBCC domain-containing protein [Streptosporangium sp. NPDC023825]|uniref:SRPBCC domain-containing protein n=1 Tax=Streptosporangium sp. NPDC023825 TaxID=3154909 RepID=UPI0034397389